MVSMWRVPQAGKGPNCRKGDSGLALGVVYIHVLVNQMRPYVPQENELRSRKRDGLSTDTPGT